MTDHRYPKEAAIWFLESIKKEFSSTYHYEFTDGPNFCLNSEFQTKLRMKFDYFNANKDVSIESIGILKEQMNKMKDEIYNINLRNIYM